MILKRVLIDTTVWIDFFHDRATPQTSCLEDHLIKDDIMLCICPIILQEVLQGIREDHQYGQVLDSLLGFEMLTVDPVEIAIKAAGIYRSLRKKGITIRKSNDCTIACYAMRHDAELLHNDRDFSVMAAHLPLREIEFEG